MGEDRKMGLGGRDRSDMIEWQSGVDGMNGLILLQRAKLVPLLYELLFANET